MGGIGPETPPKTSKKRQVSQRGGAKSGAVASDVRIDNELQLVTAIWPKLSEPIKQAILAIVRSVRET
mgnify:CR=1 FL=1